MSNLSPRLSNIQESDHPITIEMKKLNNEHNNYDTIYPKTSSMNVAMRNGSDLQNSFDTVQKKVNNIYNVQKEMVNEISKNVDRFIKRSWKHKKRSTSRSIQKKRW